MPAISESRSRASLYDFFDERKSRSMKSEASVEKRVTTEDSSTENGNVENLETPSDGNESLHCLVAGETAITPSDSEKALLDNALQKENGSIRSKTSANKRDIQDIIDTGRTAKSDSEFSAEIAPDYPDMQGAGDPVYMAMSNAEEAVQIDIILETAESEPGDRSTLITDALASAEINVDDIINDDDETSSSEEESEGEYEEDNGDVSKDLAEVAGESGDSDSDESQEAASENGHRSSSGEDDMDAESLRMDAESLEMGADSPEGSEQNDSDIGDSDTDSESDAFDEDSEKDKESTGCNAVPDNYEPGNSNQTSERSRGQYDPNSEDEYESSDDDSSDTTEEVDYVWIPGTEQVNYAWIACNTDRSDDSFSGLRQTFTPYQAYNEDAPREGTRHEIVIAEGGESNAYQTRSIKTDGEAMINFPLSMSFITRNKQDCLNEGARTISELMLALKRKRLAEIAREDSEAEQLRAETSDNRGTEVENIDEDNNSIDEQTGSYRDMEQRHDGSLERRQDAGGNTQTLTPNDENVVVGHVTDKEAKSKKVNIKSPGMKTKLEAMPSTSKTPVSNYLPNKVQISKMSHSAAQSKVTQQYPQKNLRKGTKPVLPAISKGISKSAGQETEPRLKKGRSPHKNQEHGVKRVDHRKPAIGDITVRASPVSTKQSSPRKIPLPSIPVQLHSNAYFRNGQLEVEVTCDERMYSSKEPMEVKVTFVHRHLQQKSVTKASAYKAKPARNPDRSLNSLTHPVNRNIIHQRALWPPFNTHLDTEASNRHKKIFGSL